MIAMLDCRRTEPDPTISAGCRAAVDKVCGAAKTSVVQCEACCVAHASERANTALLPLHFAALPQQCWSPVTLLFVR